MSSEISTKQKLTWLITGCSSGFGLAMARLAQANGHNVIAAFRNPSRTPELIEEFTKNGGECVRLDQDESNCGQVIEDIEARGTAIDILVNVAGFGMTGPVESFSEEEVRHMMETNFFGPYRLTRAVAPHMRKRRSGMIVNFSSGSGMEARNSLGLYGASKSALDGLTKTLHKEMSDFNVRVLLVYLGTFNTPMVGKVEPKLKPLDPDYNGTTTGKIYEIMGSGNFKVPGDHIKATQAIYDVVVGEGIGKGHENEMMLPLGVDMAVRAHEVRDSIDHMMDVFGDICNNVNVENR
ncbi:putative short-chain oxidoreductase [Annulohypoxylon maeteangense]|uniref:putative short-chain oxidoreductase n=1 Tax=Annulohypoxylon maeteangense TaxID=1927788 RepID=UPI002007D9FB|nr:putative short-chain oxidoreductase [Annulohypoxylon maeteangense]KAI0880497.1 putative short-chain oxidoreductase [Annulohypoxylon maeteangense]